MDLDWLAERSREELLKLLGEFQARSIRDARAGERLPHVGESRPRSLASARRLAKKLSGGDSRLVDPIESDPQFADAFATVNACIQRIRERMGGFGFCHLAWRLKQMALKVNYGIDWFPPSDMNPGCNFD